MSEQSLSTGPDEPAFLVVGVDGSESSHDALRWAAAEARRRSDTLRVVAAWSWPAFTAYAAVPPELDLRGGAERLVDDAVNKILGADTDIAVQRRVVEGAPAVVLLNEAKGADLLVVGSRGHGAFTGMLLGSVSTHCVSHAACPVVVIRHAKDSVTVS